MKVTLIKMKSTKSTHITYLKNVMMILPMLCLLAACGKAKEISGKINVQKAQTLSLTDDDGNKFSILSTNENEKAIIKIDEPSRWHGPAVTLKTKYGNHKISLPPLSAQLPVEIFSFSATSFTLHIEDSLSHPLTVIGEKQTRMLSEKKETKQQMCTFAGECSECVDMPDGKVSCSKSFRKSCVGLQKVLITTSALEDIYKVQFVQNSINIAEFISDGDIHTEKQGQELSACQQP